MCTRWNAMSWIQAILIVLDCNWIRIQLIVLAITINVIRVEYNPLYSIEPELHPIAWMPLISRELSLTTLIFFLIRNILQHLYHIQPLLKPFKICPYCYFISTISSNRCMVVIISKMVYRALWYKPCIVIQAFEPEWNTHTKKVGLSL